MTVCVAAMYDGSSVFGAADRMLTAGDIQFEPQQSKIIVLTRSIAVMVAGDSGMQMEIMTQVRADVDARLATEPQKWWLVGDVAELYRKYCNEARRKRSANAILAPLGLTHESFLLNQHTMSPQLVSQLATELLNYEAPRVEAIITGVDTTGAHIYVANNAAITCQDAVGFAAIGAGYWHADSQFMFAGHTKWKPMPETLLLTYSAKKRAEIAPGVGEATDMFMIGPALGSHTSIGDHVLQKLETMHKNTRKREQKSLARAEKDINKYVQELSAAATAQEQPALPEDASGNPPVNQGELRDDTQESGQEGHATGGDRATEPGGGGS